MWWCHQCGAITSHRECGGVTGVVVSLLSLQLCKSSTLASTLWSGANKHMYGVTGVASLV